MSRGFNREKFIEQAVAALKKEFERVGSKRKSQAGRSTFTAFIQKMKKYSARAVRFDDIYDLFAMRVFVNEEDAANHLSALSTTCGTRCPIPFDDLYR